jgi:hypothetical protein
MYAGTPYRPIYKCGYIRTYSTRVRHLYFIRKSYTPPPRRNICFMSAIRRYLLSTRPFAYRPTPFCIYFILNSIFPFDFLTFVPYLFSFSYFPPSNDIGSDKSCAWAGWRRVKLSCERWSGTGSTGGWSFSSFRSSWRSTDQSPPTRRSKWRSA